MHGKGGVGVCFSSERESGGESWTRLILEKDEKVWDVSSPSTKKEGGGGGKTKR